MNNSGVRVPRPEGKRQTVPPPLHPLHLRGHTAEPAGEGCAQRQPAVRSAALYLRPAVGNKGGARLSLRTQVVTCLNTVLPLYKTPNKQTKSP